MAGPDFNFEAGAVLEVGKHIDKDTAKLLLESNQAKPVKDEEGETADVAAPETAAAPAKAAESVEKPAGEKKPGILERLTGNKKAE